MKKILFSFLLIAVLLLAVIPAAQAQASLRVAVIGDSLSHEYRCKPRGNETSFNWVEIVQRVRGVNFGTGLPCYSLVFAQSGATVQQQMNGQVTGAINAFNSNAADHVIVWLGSNDVLAGTSVSVLMTTYGAQLDRLLTVYTPENILVVGLPQNDCGSNNANINAFNSQLQALAANRGVSYGDISQFCVLLNSYQVNSSTYNYGGVNVDRWAWCHINCLRLPNDGHPGTIAQALFANAVMVDFLVVDPVSEAEVLALMGIGSSPTHTPTVTRTPTATNTPAPTATPTLHILDCGAGKHWIPVDAQRVECVPNSARQVKPRVYGFQVMGASVNFGIPRCEGKPCKKEYSDKINPCPSRFTCPFVP